MSVVRTELGVKLRASPFTEDAVHFMYYLRLCVS